MENILAFEGNEITESNLNKDNQQSEKIQKAMLTLLDKVMYSGKQ